MQKQYVRIRSANYTVAAKLIESSTAGDLGAKVTLAGYVNALVEKDLKARGLIPV